MIMGYGGKYSLKVDLIYNIGLAPSYEQEKKIIRY